MVLPTSPQVSILRDLGTLHDHHLNTSFSGLTSGLLVVEVGGVSSPFSGLNTSPLVHLKVVFLYLLVHHLLYTRYYSIYSLYPSYTLLGVYIYI